MERVGHHSEITVLDAGTPPLQGPLLSPGLPDAQTSTLERNCRSPCPGMATNRLCDLHKTISPLWLSLSFPVCTSQAGGLMCANCELWPTKQVCNPVGGL